MRVYPIEGSQDAEQFTLARLARETDNNSVAVVLDNAGFHHDKALTSLYQPGQPIENLIPIYLPPCAPDRNPVEHVWNTARNSIASIQRDTPERTYSAFIDYITSRIFNYGFEHLPTRSPK